MRQQPPTKLNSTLKQIANGLMMFIGSLVAVGLLGYLMYVGFGMLAK
jgi:hypothetical protein